MAPILARWLLALYAALGLALGPAMAGEADQARAIPSLAELEAAQAKIGQIRIDTQNIFDLDDPKENNALFRLANRLHIGTKPSVIDRSLLFKSGEALSVRVIEETERLLRANSYLYDVNIRPTAYHDGIVDLEVTTRDTWTLDPGISFSRAGGKNSSSLSLQEYNLLGTGVAIGLARATDVDRTGTEFRISQDHAWDGGTSIDYAFAKLSDGKRQSISLAQPFYALDTRQADGLSLSQDNRIDSLYRNGTIVAQYRHQQDKAETFAGWSDGLIAGWTRRYSLGLAYQADAYHLEPALSPPAQLPFDQKLVAPFARYEVIEDDYRKLKNRDLVERPEYFAMGFQLRAQVGRAMTGLGGTRNLWLYSSTVSDGFNALSGHQLLTSASVTGQYGSAGVERQLLSGAARYYGPQTERSVFFVSVAGDVARNPDPADQLLLGGDNGLRGYPLRYQSGDRRALITVEERVYTDWYPFRLFRVGGAAFYDIGRAWSGSSANTVNTGWLSDVGFGLRILNARSAFNNVLHVDFAFPTHRDPNIRSFQFLIKIKNTF
jgi:hemolysin activation/secretion protein